MNTNIKLNMSPLSRRFSGIEHSVEFDDILGKASHELAFASGELELAKKNEKLLLDVLRQTKVSFIEMRNFRAYTVYRLASPKGDSVIPNNPMTIRILLALFITKVLDAKFEAGRVEDYLDSSFVIKDEDSKAVTISTGDCFNVPSSSLLTSAVERFRQLIADPTTVFSKQTAKEKVELVDNVLDAVLSYKQFKDANDSEKILKTEMAYLLHTLANYVQATLNFFVAPSTSCKMIPCKRYELPETLDAQNVNDFIKNYVGNSLCERVTIDTAETKSRETLDKIFVYNNGGLVVRPEFLAMLYEDQFYLYTEFALKAAIQYRSILKVLDKLPAYVQDLLYVKAFHQRSINEDELLLVKAFLPCPLSYAQKRFDLVDNRHMSDIEEEFNFYDKLLSEHIPLILSAIKECYEPWSFTDMTGFRLEESSFDGRRKIYRLANDRRVIHTTEIAQHLDYNQKAIHFDRAKINTRRDEAIRHSYSRQIRSGFDSVGVKSDVFSVSKYGTVIMTPNIAQPKVVWLRSMVAKACRLLLVDLSEDSSLGNRITVEFECFTILPPHEGDDIIAFGSSNVRRDYAGHLFKVSQINPFTCDFIDLIMAFSGRQVIGASNEQLQSLYLNRIENLTNESKSFMGPKMSDVVCTYRSLPCLASFLSGLVDGDGSRTESYFTPSLYDQKKAKKMRLPRYGTLPVKFSRTFKLFNVDVTPELLATLNTTPILAGPSNRYGSSVFVITRDTNGELSVEFNLTLRDHVDTGSRGKRRNKDKFLIELQYSDGLIQSNVGSGAITLLRDGAVLSWADAFKYHLPFAEEKSIIERCTEYISTMTLSLLSIILQDKSEEIPFKVELFETNLKKYLCFLEAFAPSDSISMIDVGGLTPCLVKEAIDQGKLLLEILGKVKTSDLQTGKITNELTKDLISKLTAFSEKIMPVFARELALNRHYVPTICDDRHTNFIDHVINDDIEYVDLPTMIDGLILPDMSLYIKDDVINFIKETIKASLDNMSSFINNFS